MLGSLELHSEPRSVSVTAWAEPACSTEPAKCRLPVDPAPVLVSGAGASELVLGSASVSDDYVFRPVTALMTELPSPDTATDP